MASCLPPVSPDWAAVVCDGSPCSRYCVGPYALSHALNTSEQVKASAMRRTSPPVATYGADGTRSQLSDAPTRSSRSGHCCCWMSQSTAASGHCPWSQPLLQPLERLHKGQACGLSIALDRRRIGQAPVTGGCPGQNRQGSYAASSPKVMTSSMGGASRPVNASQLFERRP